MNVICAKNYEDMSRKAANIISAQIIMKPDCVLGLATGSSPLSAYATLIDWYQKGDLDFSKVSSVNLDEYRGLSPENEQSYHYFMKIYSTISISDRIIPIFQMVWNPMQKKPAKSTMISSKN